MLLNFTELFSHRILTQTLFRHRALGTLKIYHRLAGSFEESVRWNQSSEHLVTLVNQPTQGEMKRRWLCISLDLPSCGIALYVSSLRCLFVDETDEYSRHDRHCPENWRGCIGTGVRSIQPHTDHGIVAPMTTFPVVMESRELEVCMSALLQQQTLSDLSRLADGT